MTSNDLSDYRIISVLLPIYKLFPLYYLVLKSLDINIGDLVRVPFRNKQYIGIVWELDIPKNCNTNLKKIIDKIEIGKITHSNISLIRKAAFYYLADLGSIAKLTLPVDLWCDKKEISAHAQTIPTNFQLPKLALEQIDALSSLKDVSTPGVLKGVTGSGKTEVYFHLVADCLRNGRQVLIMLPEIALSKQLVDRFKERFNFSPIVWNASITKAKKQEALMGIITNQVKLVIGARSSLFLPYADLGLIVVDEEHDTSYKQENVVLYNARDMAVMRWYIDNTTKVVLCSATPSIETLHNVKQKKYSLVELVKRYDYATMPDVHVIDMRTEQLAKNTWISDTLISEIRNTLNNKEQVLLFLNRRGYAPVVLCRACGYRFHCPDCSTWLVMHKADSKLECHHCGHANQIPSICFECKSEDTLVACGPGVERIEEEILARFPDSNVMVMSKDQSSKERFLEAFIGKMSRGEIDILIGTQVITKGYHFPNLTLVGVIDSDLGFVGADLRASERSYQLLHQVGGRAGREYKKGRVFLQSYFPDNLVLKALKTQDEQEFFNYEFRHRQENNMPPFAKVAGLIMKGKNEDAVLKFAKKSVQIAPSGNVTILGPAKAPIYKLSGQYRYRILVIADKLFPLQRYLNLWISLMKVPSSIHLTVDIDPVSFF